MEIQIIEHEITVKSKADNFQVTPDLDYCVPFDNHDKHQTHFTLTCAESDHV